MRVSVAIVAGALLLALVPVQAQQVAAIPAMTSPVVDTTGTIDAATRQRLEAQALALQQRKGSQLQVLVVPTTMPEDIAQYAVRAFDQWKVGRKGVDDGVLLVVAKDDRRVRIEVGYGLEGAIPDATSARVIQEYLVPKFRAGDYAGGITDATGALVKLIDGEPLPAPMAEHRAGRGNRGGGWLFALFVAFIVGQVARGIFGRAPSLLRGVIGAGAAGGIAWLISSMVVVGGIGAAIGFFMGLASLPSGRYARDRGHGGFGGWGGGGFGGGGGGFGGGGGWGGGGGMSGGGGASGSW
ncbi:YgcG family protein [Lysobacter sp. S4-A87]|uniref:TPM domain-containing protein n=1 Tax=Lysobacter sp. S4-A87 TaxID=2925843 RepID=UPI001F538F80|nr:YgcG family protein [Lysobacter sp. S4-A87]UNK51208.1 YgcG family protein [Lysobacter sp. S4-A87]